MFVDNLDTLVKSAIWETTVEYPKEGGVPQEVVRPSTVSNVAVAAVQSNAAFLLGGSYTRKK